MTPRFPYHLAVLWTLAVTGVLIVGVLLLSRLYPPLPKNIALVGAWEILVYVGACALFARAFGERDVGELLAFRACAPSLIGLGLALGMVLQVPANFVAGLVERVFPTPPHVLAERLAQLTPASPLHGALLFAIIALAVPLVEESFFRGALFGALCRGGADPRRIFGAAAVTALCFVIAHLDPHLWIPLLLVAAALGHLRWASGSLWPGVALHASFNGTTLLAVFSGNAPQTSAPEMGLGVALGGSALALALAFAAHVVARRRSAAGGPEVPR